MAGLFSRTEDEKEKTQERKLTYAPAGENITNICRLIRDRALGVLTIKASARGLFNQKDIFLGGSIISPQAHGVPLARILTHKNLKKDLQRKLLLSYLLARAVWQFYDSNWMAKEWCKNTVQFMWHQLDKLPELPGTIALDHRPFISTEFPAPKADPAEKGPHLYPKILALGIVLLEIELGDGIEKRFPSAYFDLQRRPLPNAERICASDLIVSEEWSSRVRMLAPVRDAIEICVKPDAEKFGTSPRLVRQQLYNSVVEPLGNFLEKMHSCPGGPHKFNLGPMYFSQSEGLCDATLGLDPVTGKSDANARLGSTMTSGPDALLACNLSYGNGMLGVACQAQAIPAPESDVEDYQLFGDGKKQFDER